MDFSLSRCVSFYLIVPRFPRPNQLRGWQSIRVCILQSTRVQCRHRIFMERHIAKCKRNAPKERQREREGERERKRWKGRKTCLFSHRSFFRKTDNSLRRIRMPHETIKKNGKIKSRPFELVRHGMGVFLRVFMLALLACYANMKVRTYAQIRTHTSLATFEPEENDCVVAVFAHRLLRNRNMIERPLRSAN